MYRVSIHFAPLSASRRGPVTANGCTRFATATRLMGQLYLFLWPPKAAATASKIALGRARMQATVTLVWKTEQIAVCVSHVS